MCPVPVRRGGTKAVLVGIICVVRQTLTFLLLESLGTEAVVICELQKWLSSWSREDLCDEQKPIEIN